LLTLLFGHGSAAIQYITVLVTFFPTLLNVGRALATISPGMRDLFALAGARRWETIRYLAVPATLPALFVGLRIGATAAVFGATEGEWPAGSQGLGLAMVKAAVSIDLTTLWTDAILKVVLTPLLTGLVGPVEHGVRGWTGRGTH
jgi:NitT/TauT family transport system permease protein